MRLDAITVLILTRDEAPNLARTLAPLAWAERIVIVDSGSVDATRDIARAHPNVDWFERPFDDHASQWNHALTATGVTTEWVLALDADYVTSVAFADELAALDAPAGISGYRASFRYAVDGRALRGALYPPVTVLFRRARGRFVQDGHTHRLALDGAVARLATPVVHDDRKPRAHWLAAQQRYVALEAAKLTRTRWGGLGWPDRLRRLKLIAPWLVPLYCLTIKRGALDGWAGWRYALERGIAESLLALALIAPDHNPRKPAGANTENAL